MSWSISGHASLFPIAWNRDVVAGETAAMLDHETETIIEDKREMRKSVWVPDPTGLQAYPGQHAHRPPCNTQE